MKSRQLATAIAKMTFLKKAHDVVIMDLRKLSPVADFFVICSSDSDVQTRAIADAVEDGMEKKGVTIWHRETGSRNWLVLDYVDVVLHVFHKNTRSYYNLEKLWGDARIQRVSEETGPVSLRTSRQHRVSGAPTTARRKVS